MLQIESDQSILIARDYVAISSAVATLQGDDFGLFQSKDQLEIEVPANLAAELKTLSLFIPTSPGSS